MLRIFVDSGSSIKESEKEKYGVEIIPLKILLGDKEYSDGVDLSLDVFYDKLINEKLFPKTSLPNLADLEDKVLEYTKAGDDVVILPISSKISGTYNAIKMLFADNKKVLVIDTLLAVGGIRILVDEINRHRDESLEAIEKYVLDLIPRIQVMAIPETLEYLQRGGRLSKVDWIIGTVLHISPVIGLYEGRVYVHAKKRGLKHAMRYIIDALDERKCDPSYEIIASYTHDKTNLEKMISNISDEYKSQIKVYDDLDPALACHWGPNAFGFIFVSKK